MEKKKVGYGKNKKDDVYNKAQQIFDELVNEHCLGEKLTPDNFRDRFSVKLVEKGLEPDTYGILEKLRKE